jgi:hypothetical protein
MASKQALKQWTLDELMAELRHRERKTRGGQTRGLATPRVSAKQGLAEVPTRELVHQVRGRQRVVYGVDDRKDIYQVKRKTVLTAADGVAALVKTSDLTPLPNGNWRLLTTSYKQEYDLCDNEPFASQPLGCFCSGFLVAPDILATAGHCVKSTADLARMRFVFGFRMSNAASATTEFGPDAVYKGTAVIGRKLEEDGGSDWALVRLERPVVGRKPLKVRKSGKVKNNQSLFVIGHPNGLPVKYADGAAVRDNSPKPFFVANLDTYGGNSGSPVFNKTKVNVEGILVRGENDFASAGSCNLSLVCPSTGCRGEDVTRASEWVEQVQKAKARARRRSRKR